MSSWTFRWVFCGVRRPSGGRPQQEVENKFGIESGLEKKLLVVSA